MGIKDQDPPASKYGNLTEPFAITIVLKPTVLTIISESAIQVRTWHPSFAGHDVDDVDDGS